MAISVISACIGSVSLKAKRGDIMLLKSYQMELFNNECMPSAMTVQCFAHLEQDVSAALPYLNAVLFGFEYIKEPLSVTFQARRFKKLSFFDCQIQHMAHFIFTTSCYKCQVCQ